MSRQRPPRGDAYERTVRHGFTARLSSYCTLAAGLLDRDDAPPVRILLITREPVERIRDELTLLAHQYVRSAVPDARVDLRREIDLRLDFPWYDVVFDPDLDGGRPDEPPLPELPPVLLVTFWQGPLVWPFRLVPIDGWIPFGRNAPVIDGCTPIALPDEASQLPNGGLLHLRYWAGRVDLRRSTERREYLIVVNGHELPAGRTLDGMPAAGYVEYHLGRVSARLSYRFDRG